MGLLFAPAAGAQDHAAQDVSVDFEGPLPSAQALPGESLEEFLWGDGRIVSASRRPQTIREIPFAVTLITREDIVRSGALTVPELFRFVPGVLVIYNDSNTPEIIMRGYPEEFSRRILVMIDGVNVLSPIHMAPDWATLPVAVNDIERIEIIRGASASTYGANAFSGVINIITQDPAERSGQDPHVNFTQAAGNLGIVQSDLRFDGNIGTLGAFRLSGQFHQDNGFGSDNGAGQFDGIRLGQGLLNAVFPVAEEKGRLTFRSWYRRAVVDRQIVTANRTIDSDDLYLVSRYDHQLTENQELSAQTWFNYSNQPGTISGQRDPERTIQIEGELTHHWRAADWDTLTSGVTFQQSRSEFLGSLPGTHALNQFSLFLNNEFRLQPNLILTIGGRYDYNTYNKNLLSARGNLSWSPFEAHTLRASVARAYRISDQGGALLNINATLPSGITVAQTGNPNLPAEEVMAYEFGYVGYFWSRLRLNVEFYYNDTRNLVSTMTTFVPPATVQGNLITGGNGAVYGVENALRAQLTDWWSWFANYTLTRQTGFYNSEFPKNMANVGTEVNFAMGFSGNVKFNWNSPYSVFVPFVGTQNIGNTYFLNVRLAQRFLKHWEAAFVGEGLVKTPRQEGGEAGVQVDRRLYGTVSFTY